MNNIEVAKKFFLALNEKNLDLLDEITHEDFVPINTLDTPSIPYDRSSFVGRSGMNKLVSGYLMAFPDFHLEILSITTNSDEVVTNFLGSGTHENDFFGIPPTGKKFVSEYYTRFIMKDGKIIGSAFLTDGLNLFSQLGKAVLLQNNEENIKEYYNVLREMGLID